MKGGYVPVTDRVCQDVVAEVFTDWEDNDAGPRGWC